MDKILKLLHSPDKSNHKLALVLIKSQGLDLYEIVKKMFHNKDFWVIFDWTITTVVYSLYIDEFDFTLQVTNAQKPNGFLNIYDLDERVIDSNENNFNNQSEEQMIQVIVNTLESIM